MSGRDCVVIHHKRTWNTARKLLSDIALSGQSICFRGQADSKWKLESSLGRLSAKLEERLGIVGDSAARKLFGESLEKDLLSEFGRAYRRISIASSLASREEADEFLATAQHYNLPTRLLDWSRSPYIAAFFAFDGCGKVPLPPGRRVAVWALDWGMMELFLYHSYLGVEPGNGVSEKTDDFEEKLKAMRSVNWPRIDKVEILGNPNRRVVYQEGLFTRVIKVEDDIEGYLSRRSQYASGTILTKIVIPGTQQAEALEDLSLMTINPVTLMDNPEGAAATALNSVVRFNPEME